MADSKQAANAETDSNDAFWRVADTFIGLANEQATEIDRGVVSAGFSYGAARFNTFVIASQCGNKEAFEAEKSAAIDYFVNQYRMALTEHIADYSANFDTYITK
ncbi:MAG: DUF3144 domain-containing protein [Methylotenera sp.]